MSHLMALGMHERGLDEMTLAVQRNEVFDALFSASSEAGPVTLDRYVVQGTLGRGGMGTVLKAFDPTLDRRVAIKVLHEELDERYAVRLRREAQALAKLSHPNVVQVYEVGEFEGQAYVVMERVKGQTLAEWMHQQERPSWRQSVDMFLLVGAGLAAAHDKGLVHRDFKPSNAIIDKKGRPRVLDFGLARQAKNFQETEQTTKQKNRSDEIEPTPLDDPLTGEGVVLGTPAYMAPEQMKGVEADPRSDQFSFCVALYEAVYGERPFEGTSLAALMVAMLHGEVRPTPEGSKVPRRLRTVLLRGLSLDPKQRWPSMEVLLTELRRLLTPRRRALYAWGMTLGLLAAGAGMSRLATSVSQCQETSQLEGVWDDMKRARVETAALDSSRAAREEWTQVAQQLDEYSRDWSDQYSDICQAMLSSSDHSVETLHEQMGCLSDRKAALVDAVQALTDAGVDAPEHPLRVVDELPSLASCSDATPLPSAP